MEEMSVDEWSAFLDGLDEVDWDDLDDCAFVCSLLLFLLPRRWMRAIEAAALSQEVWG